MRQQKHKNFSDENIEKIKQLYIDGYSIQYIAKHCFHCRSSNISSIIKDNNLDKLYPHIGKARKLNLEEQKLLCEMYQTELYTQQFLAQYFNCCSQVVSQTLREYNIPTIQHRNHVTDKQLDENYFSVIDTEAKSYFLGFIMADGNVYKNQLSIEIHLKDYNLLDGLKKELNTSNAITYRKRKNTEVVCLRIISKKIIEDLAKYGIVEDKTHNQKHLCPVPDHLLRHFLRGLLDGDGWITQDKSGYYHLGFVNHNKVICEEFKEKCNSLIEDQNYSKVTHKDNKSNCYVVQFQNQTQVKQLVTALYKDSNYYLTRKYIIAEGIFELKSDEDIV